MENMTIYDKYDALLKANTSLSVSNSHLDERIAELEQKCGRFADKKVEAEQRIAELEAHYANLFNTAWDNCYWEEGDGHGAVHTERPEWLGNFSKGEKYETPKQSMAAIQREAIKEMIDSLDWSKGIAPEDCYDYAKSLTEESE